MSAPLPGHDSGARVDAAARSVVASRDSSTSAVSNFCERTRAIASFTDESGAKLPYSGSVDAQGNVRGKADWAGRRSVLTGKIAPPALYKTFAGFGEIGQVLQFIDEQGYRLLMVGRP